jgi:beta-phosphoglucomutase-like phosphatase (HAD superfamily)
MARSALRNPEEVTSKAPTPSAISDTATVVLFDFDGTLGDTETPAMIVAFWELAPYFPEASVAYLSEECMRTYVRDNAGKAFEFMVDVVEEDRKKAGLPSIEEVRAAGAEDPLVLAHVNEQRAKSGLPTIETTRALGKDILTLQKDETVEALATLAKPCPNVPGVLADLKALGYDFSIATTSGKPRVPVSVVACQYETYFPPEKIHSGESDFEPPRFKPDPSVYLLAAEKTAALPANSVAVEDSTSGVGSAANAKMGLIVGYVGGSHISDENEDGHAGTLMAGERSDDGRGADIVVRDMRDLVPVVEHFKSVVGSGEKEGPVKFPRALLDGLVDKYWVDEARVVA